MSFTLLYWMAFIGGVILGVVVTLILRSIFIVGTLLIDHTNPKKDVYRFDIKNLEGLSKKKRILLKVDNNAKLSQK